MKFRPVLVIAALTLFTTGLIAEQADARAGRSRAGIHRSVGDRGTRTWDNNGFQSIQRTRQPAKAPSQAAPGAQPRQSWFQRNPFLAGLMGAVVGSALFAGLAHMFGGFGGLGGPLMLLLLGLLAFFVIRRFMKRPAPQGAHGHSAFDGRNPFEKQAPYQEPARFGTGAAPGATLDMPRQTKEQGLAALALNNPGFTAQKAEDQLTQAFFGIQEAWSAADKSRLATLATPEMLDYFSEDLDDMARQGERNVVKNIVMRGFDVTEAWTEGLEEYITAHIHARLVDYVERNGQVVEGSATDPIEFREVWTFTKRRGDDAWKLSAINQV